MEQRRLLTVIAGFEESLVATDLNRPVQMDFAPDGRLFVSQQSGQLRVIKDGQLLEAPFLTVPTHNTGERGLLGVTFDPDFAVNQHLYIYYTTAIGPGTYVNRVSRFNAAGDAADPASELVLFESDPLGPSTWHNGGGLRFGLDGKLYVGVGDNDKESVAQSLSSMLGKIVRINPDGSIPSDNPFYNQLSGKYRAIWAYGLRNPFTFDVQSGTGRIFVNDVGAAKWEEIDELKKGANYGWPVVEGPTTNSAYEAPFYTYPHAGGEFDDSAIAGAAFYNPPVVTFPADYVGDFFFGDYGLDTIRRIDPLTKEVSDFVSNVPEIVDVEVGPDGALYYNSRAAGRIYRTQATTSAGPTVAVQPQSQTVALGQPVTFTVEANGAELNYQWQRNGEDIAGAADSSYTIASAMPADDGAAFSVVISGSTGAIASNPAILTVQKTNTAPVATITSPADGTLWIGGGSISFAGVATDAEDGDLPPSSFTWHVDLQHDTHAHPFIEPYSGVASDTFAIPASGHGAEHNVWYRIYLTVTDSHGISTSLQRDVFPQKVNLALATEPPGLPLTLDGAAVPTPYASPAIVGFDRSLAAPQMQTLDGVDYVLDGWNDDGGAPREREVVVPSTDVTYTARYHVARPLGVLLRTSIPSTLRAGMRLPGRAAIAVTNASVTPVVGPVHARLVLVRADSPDQEVAELASVTKSLTLGGGATKVVKLATSQPLPLVPEGDYLLLAKAVAPDGVASQAPAGRPVAVRAAFVDLAVVDVHPVYAPATPRRGEKVRVTVQNNGNVPLRGPVEIQFSASFDLTPADEDDAFIARSTLNVNLAPGRTKVFTVNVVYPRQLLPGYYTLIAALDPLDVIGEDDPARPNNVGVARRSIHVGV